MAKAKKAAPPAPPPPPALPLGVYLNGNRNTAIAFKHGANGIWFLTTITGRITVEHAGDEAFKHDYPLMLPNYPLLRAVRGHYTSTLERDEQCQKVMKTLLQVI